MGLPGYLNDFISRVAFHQTKLFIAFGTLALAQLFLQLVAVAGGFVQNFFKFAVGDKRRRRGHM